MRMHFCYLFTTKDQMSAKTGTQLSVFKCYNLIFPNCSFPSAKICGHHTLRVCSSQTLFSRFKCRLMPPCHSPSPQPPPSRLHPKGTSFMGGGRRSCMGHLRSSSPVPLFAPLVRLQSVHPPAFAALPCRGG